MAVPKNPPLDVALRACRLLAQEVAEHLRKAAAAQTIGQEAEAADELHNAAAAYLRLGMAMMDTAGQVDPSHGALLDTEELATLVAAPLTLTLVESEPPPEPN